MVMWGGVGWLASEGAYYAYDSALRRFYNGKGLIWLDIFMWEQAHNFEQNRHLALMNTAQSAIEFRAN